MYGGGASGSPYQPQSVQPQPREHRPYTYVQPSGGHPPQQSGYAPSSYVPGAQASGQPAGQHSHMNPPPQGGYSGSYAPSGGGYRDAGYDARGEAGSYQPYSYQGGGGHGGGFNTSSRGWRQGEGGGGGFACVKLRGLPFGVREYEVAQFLVGFRIFLGRCIFLLGLSWVFGLKP